MTYVENNERYAAALGKTKAVLSKEALAEKNANKTGEFTKLSSTGNSSIGWSLCVKTRSLFVPCRVEANTICSIVEGGIETVRSMLLRTMSAGVSDIKETNQNRTRGMVLPFEPLLITFNEIKYAVDMPQVYIFN